MGTVFLIIVGGGTVYGGRAQRWEPGGDHREEATTLVQGGHDGAGAG